MLLQRKTYSFVLQKCLYCRAKQALLPRNIGTFATQNKGYCKALVISMLRDYSYKTTLLHEYSVLTNIQ